MYHGCFWLQVLPSGGLVGCRPLYVGGHIRVLFICAEMLILLIRRLCLGGMGRRIVGHVTGEEKYECVMLKELRICSRMVSGSVYCESWRESLLGILYL